MRKLKRSEQVLLAILGLVVLVVVALQMRSGGSKKPIAPARATRAIARTARAAASELGVVSPTPKHHPISPAIRQMFAGWGRDPFAGAHRVAPADTVKQEPDSLELAWKGILRTPRGSLVMVGPYILAEGQREGELELLKIERDYVICRFRGRTFTLFRPDREK
ncbi:MAG: hypothetical protein ONB23_07430 [candidate division KSB1 bacterium]|nr:hypothetical protein [candidate division KSB1 bacterium]